MSHCNDFGEREIIRRISAILGGIVNDDCAVIDIGDRYLVATTDMLHRVTDFPEIMTPWQIGWMTIAVNLSDIAAMGAEPSGILVATGLPPEADGYFIDELFSGLADCANYYGTKVLGGDMDAHSELTLAGCAFGFVEKDLILRRRGAKQGDILCTTGSLGGAGAGLWALKKGDSKNRLVEKLLVPEPRLKEGRALARTRALTAMMDNSDGLALSLYDLAEANKVGFVVKKEALPIAEGVIDTVGDEEAIKIVMSEGGDFELIFTVKPDDLEAARHVCEFEVIGFVVEEGIWLESDGQRKKIEPKGYEHRIGTCN